MLLEKRLTIFIYMDNVKMQSTFTSEILVERYKKTLCHVSFNRLLDLTRFILLALNANDQKFSHTEKRQ